MGTRSDIIVHRADGKWARIYCHWDGYPSHHGPLLLKYYSSPEMAEKLVALGDLSSLGPECDKPRGHSFDKPAKNRCVAYGRDRGEKGAEAMIADSLDEVWPGDDTGTEFTYIWQFDNDPDSGKWWVTSPEAGVEAAIPLDADVISGEKKVQANVKAFGVNCVIGQWK